MKIFQRKIWNHKASFVIPYRQRLSTTFEILSNSLRDARHMNAERIWEGILTGVNSLYKGVKGANKTISQTVLQWEGVSEHLHRYGGTEWRLGRRELGHIHGSYLLDIPFSKKVRDEVVAAGQAQAHHILPESGWVSFYLRQPDDVERAIALLQRSYQLAQTQQARRKSGSG